MQSSYQCFLCLTEQLLEFMHQLPAFANMTMSVRRELCSVMIFEVVEQAGAIILEDGQEVSYCLQHNLSAIGSGLARASGGNGLENLFPISAPLPHLKENSSLTVTHIQNPQTVAHPFGRFCLCITVLFKTSTQPSTDIKQHSVYCSQIKC